MKVYLFGHLYKLPFAVSVILNISKMCANNNKGRYALGDRLQQKVAATDHSVCTGPATSCSNMLRRHIAATNRFVCTAEIL